ncbi:MAG: AraC family transcriptional regulator [Oscillospiraceae bacterium]|nr:AraC family transcriptional regulator [Oscillospiraceae bacterium]
MLIYEKEWFDSKGLYTTYTIDTLNYTHHFHNTFEINYIFDGEIDVTIDDLKYTLCKGDAVIIFPGQIHSYKSEKPSKMFSVMFSTDMIGSFSKKYDGLLPDNNLLKGLSIFADRVATENHYIQKGILYEICGMLENSTGFHAENNKKDLKLLHKVLTFIDENYKSDCSLKTVAKLLNYSYTYVSKRFSQHMGMSYTEYLNRFRVSRAIYLLDSGNYTSISTVCSECGFDSICSFNRNFKKYAGITPSEIGKGRNK